MKKISRLLFVLILTFSWSVPCLQLNADVTSASAPPNQEPEISMDFQDVNLKDLLKIFSIQSGMNFVASEAVQDRRLTLYLDKVPLNKAMEKLFTVNNLAYEYDKDANIFVVKDWGKPQLETRTRVYYLKYQNVPSASIGKADEAGTASVNNLVASIREIMSPNGKVNEDARTNSLIITDVPSSFPKIEELIARLDIPEPQVMLEVEILDVSKGAIDKLGVNWPESVGSLDMTNSKKMTKMPFTPGEVLPLNATSALSNRFNPATLTIIGAKLTLDFLKTFSDTKSLARPKILTLNHQTAEIKITTDEVISVKTEFAAVGDTTKETKTYERANTGVTLKVTPMVNSETGEITMRINPIERNTRKSDFSTTAELVKDVEERSAKSLVKLKDGETVIMGGLIRNQFEQTNTKLPILGDIPFVGMLFRHKDKTKDVERELIVFITPRVIKDTNIQLAQAKKIILPEREQSTISGVSRELYINTSLNAFEKSRK